MKFRNIELWTALLVILLITGLYWLAVARLNISPAASGLLGHGLGIIGFILMLMTETLYSLRKRVRGARWGRMVIWLRFHIFTGLVGPYLVLLHTTWKYNGVAGMALLLMLVLVISGFIGRYIYNAVPRTPAGATVKAAELEQQLQTIRSELARWTTSYPRLSETLDKLVTPPESGSSLVLGRLWWTWQAHLHWRREKRRLQAAGVPRLAELEIVLIRRLTLQRQIASLAAARQLLSLWRAMHIPLGVSLFVLAFIHIGGALYYATLLR